MANFGPLTAENDSGVWGIPANFNGFRVLPSLLQRRRSPEANQTLHDVWAFWPSPGLVHYVYIFEGSCPLTEFCSVQYSLYVQVLRSPIFPVLVHGTRVVGVSETVWRSAAGAIYIWQGGHEPSFAAWYKEWNCELSQRAPPIFGRAAIRLGTDPHCSCSSVLCTFRKQKMTVLANSKVSDVKVT